jgi:hypothetical protein
LPEVEVMDATEAAKRIISVAALQLPNSDSSDLISTQWAATVARAYLDLRERIDKAAKRIEAMDQGAKAKGLAEYAIGYEDALVILRQEGVLR